MGLFRPSLPGEGLGVTRVAHLREGVLVLPSWRALSSLVFTMDRANACGSAMS